MPKRMLIGLTGLAGSGKSTIASNLVLEHGFRRHRFAGPLKDMLRALGLTDAQIDGEHKEVACEELGWNTPRYAMQTLGTEWGRAHMGPNFWVNLAKARIKDDLLRASVVVDDVRFQNEVEAIRAMGGRVLRVVRPGTAGAGSHVSESQDFDVDGTIGNSGSLDELRAEIWAVIGLLREAA